jgi:membrane protein YqaA with SNARE-associated domain
MLINCSVTSSFVFTNSSSIYEIIISILLEDPLSIFLLSFLGESLGVLAAFFFGGMVPNYNKNNKNEKIFPDTTMSYHKIHKIISSH